MELSLQLMIFTINRKAIYYCFTYSHKQYHLYVSIGFHAMSQNNNKCFLFWEISLDNKEYINASYLIATVLDINQENSTKCYYCHTTDYY